jgi:hypothetical protein
MPLTVTTWDWRFHFPSEGSRATDFITLKRPSSSAGFKPANLGSSSKHAATRPPRATDTYFSTAPWKHISRIGRTCITAASIPKLNNQVGRLILINFQHPTHHSRKLLRWFVGKPLRSRGHKWEGVNQRTGLYVVSSLFMFAEWKCGHRRYAGYHASCTRKCHGLASHVFQYMQCYHKLHIWK